MGFRRAGFGWLGFSLSELMENKLDDIQVEVKEIIEDSIHRIAKSSEKMASVQDDAVWISIFCAVSNSPETSIKTAIKWADDGLDAFRQRFFGTRQEKTQ